LDEKLIAAEKISAAKQAKLDASLKLMRAEAEAEYLKKHGEAVFQTEGYLASATKDMEALTARVQELRFEIETLELEASVTQKRIIAEARDKAEAIIAAADSEARQKIAEANLAASSERSRAQSEVAVLQNQSAAIEIYLENLRNLVTGELARRTDGTAHKAN
jgi:hypothetical protein